MANPIVTAFRVTELLRICSAERRTTNSTTSRNRRMEPMTKKAQRQLRERRKRPI
jgi:hypothetical protein